MTEEIITCLLCDGQCDHDIQSLNLDHVYMCKAGCGKYWVTLDVDEDRGHHEFEAKRPLLAGLLRELRLREGRIPFFYRDSLPQNCGPGFVFLHVEEFPQEWPSGTLELLDRSLCSLIEVSRRRGSLLAQRLSIDGERPRELVCLSRSTSESLEVLRLMHDRGWVRLVSDDKGNAMASVLAAGWERYEELTRGRATRNNPVFIAMWFGKPDAKGEPDRTAEMDEVHDAIKTACQSAGWNAELTNARHHNDLIVDKMLYQVRRAPFLVADLTNNNANVFFEAGYAKGLGREVFLCCPVGAKTKFDLAGFNQVRYANADELRHKLENAILNVMDRGPKAGDELEQQ